MHPLCFTCWKKVYQGGEGKCPTCRGKLSDKRNIPLEKILEKLDKKKCKFDGCPFERNSSALVTEHEENCSHKTFKCRWSEHGCNFEAPNKAFVREHEDNECEHNLSKQIEAELSIAQAANKEKPKKEKPKKDKRTRKAEATATLMPDGLCWKHHKYGERAHKCDLPSQCIWNNESVLPSASGPSFEHKETSVLEAEESVCKFHGCSLGVVNAKKFCC